MPWCPKCKNEYRDGITKCADCGSVLVAELNAEDDTSVLCFIHSEQAVTKLVSYLEYSGIKATIAFDDDEQAYAVSVPEKDIKKAKVEYKAFLSVEAAPAPIPLEAEENFTVEVLGEDEESGDINKVLKIENLEDLKKLQENGINTEELTRKTMEAAASAYKPAGVYQSQSEKANELSSTGYTFLIIGIAMLIFTILNFAKVITLFDGNYGTLAILTALSLAACFVGISCFKRSKSANSQVAAEEKLTAELNDWMEKHKDIMTAGDLSGDDGIGEEILYLKRTAAMKDAIEKFFGKLDEDYVDSLIDDFYNKNF